MKKNVLTLLTILVLTAMLSCAQAKPVSSELSDAINLYKSGNYSESYIQLEKIVGQDPANALAYYYLGMTCAQIGRKDEAIENYDKAITLTPYNNNLSRFAKKGKRCLETPDKCEDTLYESLEDEFILNKKGPKFTEKVKGDYERLKIENLMREMNREDSLDAQKFKEYKDFSSLPTNDDIVAALRVLQKAGFSDVINNNFVDISAMTGGLSQSSLYGFMGNSSMNPQLIQALLTNNITQGF